MAINTSPEIMDLTLSSILSCLLSSSLLIISAWLILKNTSGLKWIGKYSPILLAVIFIRMVFPVEFHFSKSFYSKHVMTAVMDFLNFKISMGICCLSVGQILIALWIVGAAYRFWLEVMQYRHLSADIHNYKESPMEIIQPIIDRINCELGRQKKFDVRLLPETKSPYIWGILHPTIILPPMQYEEQRLYYILKHEMLHYYHHDIVAKLFCEALCIIYWWNPFVFLLRKMVTNITEFHVDHSVTKDMDEDKKTEYLQSILSVMQHSKKNRPPLIQALAASKEPVIIQRFQCVLNNYWVTRRVRGICITMLSILLLILSVSIIFEAEYSSDIPGTFDCPTPETSYLIKNGKYYELYINDEYVGKTPELIDLLSDIPIHDEKEIHTNEK